MLKYLGFAYHLFCKRVIMSFLLILQLTIAFLLLESMITYTAQKYTSVTAFASLSKVNGVHFSTEYDGDLDNVFNAIISERPDVDIITGVSYSLENGKTILFYEPEFIKYYSPQITKGTWLYNELISYTNTIPVVSFGDNSIGDKIKINEDTYLEIVGNTNEEHYVSFDSYGANMNTQLLMEKANNNIVLAVLNSYIAEKLNVYAYGMPNVYLLMTESEYNLNHVAERLLEYGTVNSFEDIMTNGHDTAFEQFKVLLPFFVFSYVLALFGLISGIIITISKNINMFTVMYITGATRTQCGFIVFVDVALYIFGALLLYKLISTILFSGLNGFFENVLFLSILVCCIFVFIIAVMPICMLHKNKIFQNLKADR